MTQIELGERPLFHVHTYRCNHAEKVPDEDYILKGIDLGATDIWFTDHAPFPGDPFNNRMRYDQLPEYIADLSKLQYEYQDKINVHIGLEIEYLPKFDKQGYYESLLDNPNIELLLLGQHFAQIGDTYSFAPSYISDDYKYISDAIFDAVDTGYFPIIAHPDRMFRRRNHWNEEFGKISEVLCWLAKSHGIILEQNLASMNRPGCYKEEFWEMANYYRNDIVTGLDAHRLRYLLKTW